MTIRTTRSLEREIEALRLRRSGATYADIATEMGFVDASGARKCVRRALDRCVFDEAEELRAMELDRYDDMQRAVWPAALAGDEKAIEVVLKISDRRRKLVPALEVPAEMELRVEQVSADDFATYLAGAWDAFEQTAET